MVVDHSDFEALTQAIKQADTIVIGPGLGLDKLAKQILKNNFNSSRSNYDPDHRWVRDHAPCTTKKRALTSDMSGDLHPTPSRMGSFIWTSAYRATTSSQSKRPTKTSRHIVLKSITLRSIILIIRSVACLLVVPTWQLVVWAIL